MKRTVVAFLAAALLLGLPGTASAAEWRDPGDIAVSPDGRHVYASGGTLLTYARESGTGRLAPVGELPIQGRRLALSPDGAFVYVASEDRIDVLARDAATGLLTPADPVLGGPSYGISFGGITDIAVAPDGRTLYVTQRNEHALAALRRDPATGSISRGAVYFAADDPGAHFPNAPRLVTTPDGRDLYVIDNAVAHFRQDANGSLVRLPNAGIAENAVVTSGGKAVYATDGGSRATYIRDPETGQWSGGASTYVPDQNCAGCWDTAPIVSGGAARFFTADAARGVVHTIATVGPAVAGTVRNIPDLPTIAELAVSPDQRFVYATGGGMNDARRRPSGRGAIATIRVDGNDLTHVETIVPGVADRTLHRYPGVSIDDGAIWVNSREVTLTVNRPGWNPTAIEVSNDPSFEGAVRMVVKSGDRYPWRLAAGSAPERMVKRVYVRFVPNGTSDWEYFARAVALDDVILDTRDPQVESARVRGTRLVLKARDDRSGVKRMQVTTNRRKPGAARAFRSRPAKPRGSKPVYVRVFDAAGNASSWKRAAR
jgi:hypothetical protein